jgi:hypothetical protein
MSGCYKTTTLTNFFEKIIKIDIQTPSEELIKLKEKKDSIVTELKELQKIPKNLRDQQLKKDISWKNSKLVDIAQKRRRLEETLFQKLFQED